jgi:zinc D-Ala-D-Ala carboxypeptidase
MPASSPHFRSSEFACPHCGVELVRPRLLVVLERIRALRNRPITIVSGYRCPVHNRDVHGAVDSQHMYGAAADIPRGTCTFDEAVSCGATGVGTKDGVPVHVDVRDGKLAHWTY